MFCPTILDLSTQTPVATTAVFTPESLTPAARILPRARMEVWGP